tara:strand:- start:359 stop:829 length:471 start_codon:yes stop_codon:yes gene_type:complete
MSLSKIREMQVKAKEMENKLKNESEISISTRNLIPGAKTIKHVPGINKLYDYTDIKYSINNKGEMKLNVGVGLYSYEIDKNGNKESSINIPSSISFPFNIVREEISYNGNHATISNIFGPIEIKRKYEMSDYYSKIGRMTGNPLAPMYEKAFENLL